MKPFIFMWEAGLYRDEIVPSVGLEAGICPVQQHTMTSLNIAVVFLLHPPSFFRSAINATGSSCLLLSGPFQHVLTAAPLFHLSLEGDVAPLSNRPQNKRRKKKRLHGSGLGVRTV